LKIAILTSHFLESKKETNIHYIFNILKKANHEVDWVTYPVSLSLLRKHNSFKRKAFFKGYFKQKFIFVLFPPYIFSNKIFRFFLSFSFFRNCSKKKYDLLITEGYQSSYIYTNFCFKKLIHRMSDDEKYLKFFSDEEKLYKKMTDSADKIWSVLKKTSKNFDNFIYLPNPSVHEKIIINNNKKNEAVYVGSNKFNVSLVKALAEEGIKINIYSEKQNIFHKNVKYHGLVDKKNLPKELSQYKVGIIPFDLDEKNKFMEIPLKTFDYIASGLHIIMFSSSDEIKTNIIINVDNQEDFINITKKKMFEEPNYFEYQKVLEEKSFKMFSNSIEAFVREIF